MMKSFSKFFKLEFNRLLTIKYLIVGVLFFLLAMYLLQCGANRYREILRDKESFKLMEKHKVSQYQYYWQYGAHGFRVLYIPSPLSVFHDKSGLFSEITASINTNERLSISDSFIGKDVFRRLYALYADFSGIFLFLGSLILLVYGWLTFRHVEYWKCLTSLGNRLKVYSCSILSRFLLLSLFFIFTLAAGIVLVSINGIHLQGSHYAGLLNLLLKWELAAFGFFIMGTIIGIIKNSSLGIGVLVGAWLISIFLLPMLIINITMASSWDIPSNYQMEKKKFDELIKFEGRAININGRYSGKESKTKIVRDIIDSFMDNEYKKIREYEFDLAGELQRNVKLTHWLSVISPATFFSAGTCEQSSKGYMNSLDFYRYLMGLKHEFCLYYRKKKFYSDDTKVESFITDDEKYLFYGKSRLPGNNFPGIFIILGQLVVLTGLSYMSFKYFLFGLSRGQIKKMNNKDVVLKDGKPKIFRTIDGLLACLLYSLFSGRFKDIVKKGFSREFRVEGLGKKAPGSRLDFFYFSSERFFPGDIRIGDFISLCASLPGLTVKDLEEIVAVPGIKCIVQKRFKSLLIREIGEVPLALVRMKKREAYLFFDTASDTHARCALKIMKMIEELVENGALAVYVKTHDSFRTDSQEVDHYWEEPQWLTQAESLENFLRKEEEK